MKLPEYLQKFPRGALIIVSDTIAATCFLVGGDSVEKIDGVALLRQRASDAEGFMSATEDPELERIQTYGRLLARHIDALMQNHSVPDVHFIMPAKVEEIVLAHLSRATQQHIKKHLHLDVVKEHPLEIIKRVADG